MAGNDEGQGEDERPTAAQVIDFHTIRGVQALGQRPSMVAGHLQR